MGSYGDLWKSLHTPEREALRLRQKSCLDSHQVRGMFFSSSLEIVRRLLDDEAATAVAEAAKLQTKDFAIMRKYSLRDFMELEWHAAARLEPVFGSFEDGLARVGAGAVEIFYESVAGRTMKLLGGSDPHRLMAAAPNAYPLTYNDDGKRSYTRVDERHGRFEFEGDLLGPCHQIGVFKTAIKLACDIEISVQLAQPELLTFTLDVTW